MDEAVECSQSGRSAKGHMCWVEMAMNTYFRRGGTLGNIRLDAHSRLYLMQMEEPERDWRVHSGVMGHEVVKETVREVFGVSSEQRKEDEETWCWMME